MNKRFCCNKCTCLIYAKQKITLPHIGVFTFFAQKHEISSKDESKRGVFGQFWYFFVKKHILKKVKKSAKFAPNGAKI